MAVVLCYHHVCEAPDEHATSPRRFREHLVALRDAGYAFVSHDEFVERAERGFRGDRKSVLVTTDDGDADNWHWAFPILRELGVPATFFVITDEVADGDPRPRSDEGARAEPALDARVRWSELERMQRSGLVSVQSHTAAHRDLRPMAADTAALESFLRDDLPRSRRAIAERLGRLPVSLAWPWGVHNAVSRRVAAEAGYAWQYTVVPGDNGPSTNPQALYRYCADGLPASAVLRMIDVLSTPVVGRSYSFARHVYNRARNLAYGV